MTNQEELPELFIQRLQSVTNKRARIVIDHILEHGFITTEELEKQYGYSHAHVALREVRRTDILWDKAEVQIYNELKTAAEKANFPIPDYVKQIVRQHLGGEL